MENKNFTATIEVSKSAEEVFNHVNDVSQWWAKNVKGNSSKMHDVFTVYFGKTFGTFKIVDLDPNKRIVWYTVDCYLDIFSNKELWKYTNLVWEIIPGESSTTILMTHIGLFPGIECYEDCKLGWDFYIKESLYKFITEKKGLPGTGIRARIVNDDRIYEGIMYSTEDPFPATSGDHLIIDIKEAAGEQIISAFSINQRDNKSFGKGSFQGNYYMILENKPVKEGIQPIKDLQTFFKL